MVITSKSLKTLGLTKLKSIENGEVHLKAESLCLHDSINWDLILSTKNSLTYNKLINEGKNCGNIILISTSYKNCVKFYLFFRQESEGYMCDQACNGCWNVGPKSCQFCKTYKLDDRCVEECSGQQKSNNDKLQYIYLSKNETRECDYCHIECKNGCSGPVRKLSKINMHMLYNYQILINKKTERDCVECRNYKLKVNQTAFQCVEKCPLLHYSDSAKKECLPCYEHCYECTGPKDTIGK